MRDVLPFVFLYVAIVALMCSPALAALLHWSLN